ncbi:energy-coupling factor ABC transporter ATP-binding protein [Guggenheimella bovis]
MFQLSDVSFSYEDDLVLKDIELTIEEGERVCLIGSNGSGKSTLLSLLIGLEHAKKGKLSFKGQPYSKDKTFLRTLRREIGFLFQDPDTMMIAPTVFEEISFSAVNQKTDEEIIEKRVEMLCKRFSLEGFEERVVYHLSGGEKKRVNLASVLVTDPKVLLIDEPESSLDPYQRTVMESYLESIDKTFVVATHDMNFVWQFATRVVVLHEGRILFDGKKEAFFSNEALVNEANLELPVFYLISKLLQKKGIIEEDKLFYRKEELCEAFYL